MKKLQFKILQNKMINNSKIVIETQKAEAIIGYIFHITGFKNKVEILKEMERHNLIKFKNRDLIEINCDLMEIKGYPELIYSLNRKKW